MAGEVMNFQAFPAEGRKGMGFREYAAAAALQGILASGSASDAPQKAVELADALIRELQKGQPEPLAIYGD
jgi:hypothetical protein